MLAFSTQVCRFKPGQSCWVFTGEKILSMPSFGWEVKPLAPCRRFAACKRSLKWHGSRHFGKIIRHHCHPQFLLLLLGYLASLQTWRHLAVKVGMSKVGGKQWQPIPKSLPRMQCARAILVAWLGCRSCQNQPKGWILMNEQIWIHLKG
jgi:hypothetical protein